MNYIYEPINFINNLQQIIFMIPVSNGKSPRVDQFYASLRYFKSNHFDSEARLRTEEDFSIQHIRSIGKEILQRNPPKGKKKNINRTLDVEPKIDENADNLYDKYKHKNQKHYERLIVRRREQIVRDQTTSKEKLQKRKKYEQVESKVYNKTGIKDLNYKKRADMKAEELREMKRNVQASKKQIKQKQIFYQKKINPKEPPRRDLFDRSIEIQMRKSLSIEKRKQQLEQKQLQNVTFTPQRVSKDLVKNSSGFMDRLPSIHSNKLSKEKQMLRNTLSTHQFRPHINSNNQVPSVIKKIWETQKDIESSGQQQVQKNDQEEQPTMNSTTRITLKNMDQLSFMLS